MSFNQTPIVVRATVYKHRDTSRWPPAWRPQNWILHEEIKYNVGSLEHPRDVITVPSGYVFDGASVPVLFTVFFPKAHPLYMKAACLHDWLYENAGRHTYSREEVDEIFKEALLVLGMPKLYANCMFWAVRIGGRKYWKRNLEKNL